jgi:hypothetical protein
MTSCFEGMHKKRRIHFPELRGAKTNFFIKFKILFNGCNLLSVRHFNLKSLTQWHNGIGKNATNIYGGFIYIGSLVHATNYSAASIGCF